MTSEENRLRKLARLALSEEEHRYWSKVTIVDDADSCWDWTRARAAKPDNYGRIQVTHPETGKKANMNASRYGFYLVHGYLPPVVRHTCDRPPCCRPKHWLPGTHADNTADMDARGRRVNGDQRGEANPASKLHAQDVIGIRERAVMGHSHTAIAKIYKVSRETITLIATGKTWTHVGGPIQTIETGNARSPITAADVREIRKSVECGARQADLAVVYGVSAATISNIVAGKVWKNV
jgi:hypothetical protein